MDGEAAVSGKMVMVTNVDHLISSGPFFGRGGSKLESVDLHILDRMERINSSLYMESVSRPSDVAKCFVKCALFLSRRLVASNPLSLSSNQSEALNNGYLGSGIGLDGEFPDPVPSHPRGLSSVDHIQ